MAHAVVHLNRQCLVVAIDAAKDVRHGAEVRVGTCSKNRRCERAFQRAAAYDLVREGSGGRTNVDVRKVRKLSSEASQVANGKYRARSQVLFQGQIQLVDLRVLEI